MQDHPVGILLVALEKESEELSKDEIQVLTSVSHQVAVGLGTTLLCIDRARNLAIEQERNRIAREIHDTVAQSLFGIVFSLDACINMLPNEVDNVMDELVEIRSLASGARDDIRLSIFDIWPTQLSIEQFTSDLEEYTRQYCRPQKFDINFTTRGEFENLSSGVKRSLYRIAQEALSNSARHSGAKTASVCINVDQTQVGMSITDNGRGFNPDLMLAREYDRERFGLHGIQERANALGGEAFIISKEGLGTKLLIDIPILNHG